jgi:hypothetical protein
MLIGLRVLPQKATGAASRIIHACLLDAYVFVIANRRTNHAGRTGTGSQYHGELRLRQFLSPAQQIWRGDRARRGLA